MQLQPADIQKRLFGECLRAARAKTGLSQEALADIALLDRTYVSSCERGERNISLENIWKLALALGVKPSALFKNEGEFRPANRRRTS